MHPILISRTRLALYLLAWTPLAAAGAVMFSLAGHLPWARSAATAAALAVFYAMVCLSPWYSGRYLPLHPAALGKLLVNHTAAALVAAALLLGLAGLLGAPDAQRPFLFGAGVLLYLLAVALHYVLLSFQTSREAESRMHEARVQAREAELKALKAQINPHFLFNSLNSIGALAPADGARAREMCLRLAEFLRATLDLAEEEIIPIEEEMALARTYLEVEQVRFGQRLQVAQDIEEGCGECDVPPLLVQPLVENAIKHGIATLVEGGEISMRGRRSADSLRFVIENPFDPEAPSTRKNGIGLANVRNRLEARYGSAARLEVQVEQDRYRVTLSLPCVPKR